jgi:hypothetical protein
MFKVSGELLSFSFKAEDEKYGLRIKFEYIV